MADGEVIPFDVRGDGPGVSVVGLRSPGRGPGSSVPLAQLLRVLGLELGR